MIEVNARENPTSSFNTRLRELRRRTRLRALGHGLMRLGAAGGLMLLLATWAVGGPAGPGAFNGWGLTLSLLLGLAIGLASTFIDY